VPPPSLRHVTKSASPFDALFEQASDFAPHEKQFADYIRMILHICGMLTELHSVGGQSVWIFVSHMFLKRSRASSMYFTGRSGPGSCHSGHGVHACKHCKLEFR
jgi:hypothetical protein